MFFLFLVARQEAREAELRRDLASSQNRCNELCTHVAQMERTLNRMRTGTLERPSPSSGISQFVRPVCLILSSVLFTLLGS